MFNFLKNNLKKIYSDTATKLSTLLSGKTVDDATLQELERLLVAADVGVSITKDLITQLKKNLPAGATGSTCKALLKEQLTQLLTQEKPKTEATVHLLVGINGSGKTTFAGKLAHAYAQEGKRVLLVAGDTFRAAAPQQLQEWASRTNTNILIGKQDQEPASLIFEACEVFKQGTYDKLIIDTAGRLQTKTNLMKELEKINKIITKQLPTHTVETLLVVDAMLGQNSLEQAKLFHEVTPLSGVVLTKMDGTGKGGIVFAITHLLHIPIAYISYGEKVEDMQSFNPQEYVNQLLNS